MDILCHPRRLKQIPRKILLWRRANIAAIKESLKVEIDSFCENYEAESVENQWSQFKNIANNTLKEIPTKSTSSRFNQPWFTRKCNSLLKRTKRLYRRAKRKNMSTDWDRYNNAIKVYRKECKTAHDNYLNEKVFSEEANNKRFFTYVKSKRQDNVSVPALKVNEKFLIDDSMKADALNEQYCSVFSKPDDIIPPINTPKIDENMPDIVVSQEGVQALLSRLKPSKAPGPDEIASRFLKEFSAELAPALTLIFSNSLDKAKLPKDWLHARVSPIYKGSNKDRSSPESYRPISLTCICCKIFEHIVYSNVIKHLNQHKAIVDVQHGFREKRSCESQLLVTINDFAKALNDGQQIDTTLLDFSKAFDKVDHRKLCLKLTHYGINGKCHAWIRAFLSNRTKKLFLMESHPRKQTSHLEAHKEQYWGPYFFLFT